MTARFAAEGKPGVISRSGARYSTWWNGGLRTTAYFHNMIGILTETSHASPTPRFYDPEKRPEFVGNPRRGTALSTSGMAIAEPKPSLTTAIFRPLRSPDSALT